MQKKTPTARERLLTAARELFYTKGITATGIDTITKQAGVAKMSLYNNFSSKAELVAAYIEERDNEWTAIYSRREDTAINPKERVLAVIDAYIDHADIEYAAHGFRGCGMMNAAAELELDSPTRDAIRKHKTMVKSLFEKHVLELPSVTKEQAAEIAETFSFILEGAMVCSGLDGDSSKVHSAKRIIAAMLDNIELQGSQCNA
ncbi:TetR/AcrR family transcriptional regulator [Maridesulfovibrio sp.]|uniref:TetR/AcrR family transcriptional regulator n=1 Tax=Maridesulfovibrio sp. TaxID=2795000 RepID=UPI002A18B6D0|nr:TetR/AcrR family transcriptional regulator [Maridesulfovibrio sp.]